MTHNVLKHAPSPDTTKTEYLSHYSKSLHILRVNSENWVIFAAYRSHELQAQLSTEATY